MGLLRYVFFAKASELIGCRSIDGKSHPEIRDNDNGQVTRVDNKLRGVGDAGRFLVELIQGHSSDHRRLGQVRRNRSKQFAGSARVSRNTGRPAFARFDERGCQLDQPFEEFRRLSASSQGQPNRLPAFMRFPIIAVVEQVDAEQIRAARLPFA